MHGFHAEGDRGTRRDPLPVDRIHIDLAALDGDGDLIKSNELAGAQHQGIRRHGIHQFDDADVRLKIVPLESWIRLPEVGAWPTSALRIGRRRLPGNLPETGRRQERTPGEGTSLRGE